MTAGQSIPAPPPLNRGVSTDGYIKGYKDVPSLAQISKRVQNKEKEAQAEAEKGQSAEKQELAVDKSSQRTGSVEKVEVAQANMTAEASKSTSETVEHPLEHTW